MLKNINIDSELHRRIKLYCVTHDISITDFVQDTVSEKLSEKIPAEKIIVEKDVPERTTRDVGERTFDEVVKTAGLCKHGAMKGLCKKGCK